MAGYLTTHVLDTARGRPAAGLQIELYRITASNRVFVAAQSTNADGRTDTPILPAEDFELGTYELVFHAGDYLRKQGATGDLFLDVIPIRFGLTEPSHFHVPLLLQPFGYSTYRGS